MTLADTKQPRLLFETNLPTRYYIPPEDVDRDLLVDSDTRTRCPYKGVASYWSVQAGKTLLEDLAWYYPDPLPEMPKIKGLYANEKVDIYIDGELETRPKTRYS